MPGNNSLEREQGWQLLTQHVPNAETVLISRVNNTSYANVPTGVRQSVLLGPKPNHCPESQPPIEAHLAA